MNSSGHLRNRENLANWLLCGRALSCVAQFFWFGAKCIHQIDIDGIDYIGIARHLRAHEFYLAINDFRSPLFSWMIAAGSLFGGDFVRVGKFLNICSYLLCVVLLYFFTKSLWQSKLLAAVAVFWLSLCRGLTAIAVEMVTPDLLLAALVLAYFIVLLRCLRAGEGKYWCWLGVIHGVAFLTKSFALPWLALCTLVAVILSAEPKRWLSRLAFAGVVPLLVAMFWADVLHTKYGVFTTGTQFKANYLQWSAHAYDNRPDRRYAVLSDTTPYMDADNVGDPMPPGAWPWRYPVTLRDAVPKLVAAEVRNLPKAAKEFFIVLTPGGLIAFGWMCTILWGQRRAAPVEFAVAAVVAVGTAALLVAYCMLVFDGRYLYPVIPLVMAVGLGIFLEPLGVGSRKVLGAVIALGVVAFLLYSSSLFRVLDRDFQVSCYRAGEILRAHSGNTVVTVGSGPYQEHGVGWEAGYKAAYFGGRRLIGATHALPDLGRVGALLGDLSKAAPDVVLIWGRPGDVRYGELVRRVVVDGSVAELIVDPALGEVGIVVLVRR